MRRVLALIALAGCHNFDDGFAQCVAKGICLGSSVDGGAGGSDGGSGDGGGVDGGDGGFAASANPTLVNVGPGGVGQTMITVARPATNYELVTLWLAPSDAGFRATFQPPILFSGSTLATMRIHAPLPLPVATYDLTVIARFDDGGTAASTTIQVSARAPAATLLVDDDRGSNNVTFGAALSEEDLFFSSALTSKGVAFDTLVRPAFPDSGIGITLDQVRSYTSIVWYAGESFGAANILDQIDRDVLARWLDQGNRKLILNSMYYNYYSAGTWPNTTGNPFYFDYLGGLGGYSLDPPGPSALLGVTGQATAGLSLVLSHDNPFTDAYIGLINPRPGTVALITVLADPNGNGLRDLACATKRTTVGDAGTSTVVFVAFPISNIVDTDGGRMTVWEALRSAAAIP